MLSILISDAMARNLPVGNVLRLTSPMLASMTTARGRLVLKLYERKSLGWKRKLLICAIQKTRLPRRSCFMTHTLHWGPPPLGCLGLDEALLILVIARALRRLLPLRRLVLLAQVASDCLLPALRMEASVRCSITISALSQFLSLIAEYCYYFICIYKIWVHLLQDLHRQGSVICEFPNHLFNID